MDTTEFIRARFPHGVQWLKEHGMYQNLVQTILEEFQHFDATLVSKLYLENLYQDLVGAFRNFVSRETSAIYQAAIKEPKRTPFFSIYAHSDNFALYMKTSVLPAYQVKAIARSETCQNFLFEIPMIRKLKNDLDDMVRKGFVDHPKFIKSYLTHLQEKGDHENTSFSLQLMKKMKGDVQDYIRNTYLPQEQISEALLFVTAYFEDGMNNYMMEVLRDIINLNNKDIERKLNFFINDVTTDFTKVIYQQVRLGNDYNFIRLGLIRSLEDTRFLGLLRKVLMQGFSRLQLPPKKVLAGSAEETQIQNIPQSAAS